MTQLTKAYFDQQLKKLATTKALAGVSATLNRTTALVANLAEDFREFREEMKNVPSILDSHTTTLDAIFKNTEIWKAEKAAFKATI